MDSYDLHEVLNKMRSEYDTRLQQVQRRQEAVLSQMQQRDNEQRYYDHLTRQTEEAVRAYPVFKDPGLKEMLQYQIAARIQNASDISKVNAVEVAKRMASAFQAQADALYKQKIGVKTVAGKPAAPAGKPVKGSASKPGQGKAKIESFDDFDAAQEGFLDSLAAQMQEELG
jgi:hypothetical protein